MIYDVYGNIVSNSILDSFRDSAYVKLLRTEQYGTMQGGCTDGTYIYYIMYNLNKICKYHILSQTIETRTYSSGLYGHANSLTYNPNTNKIYVTVMDEAGHIGVIDPNTLADVDMFVLEDSQGAAVQSSGIAYDRKNNCYLITKGASGYFFNSNFEFISAFTFPATSLTYQGVECDGQHIYRPLWDSSNSISIICIYDYTGQLITDIAVPVLNELEEVMNDWKNNWYLNFNIVGGGGSLYYTGLLTTTNFETVSQIHSILDI